MEEELEKLQFYQELVIDNINCFEKKLKKLNLIQKKRLNLI